MASASSFGQDSDRLLDREPFDRVILDVANGNKTLDVLPLGISGGEAEGGLPRSGQLEFRLVNSPTRRYAVPWGHVVEIRPYPKLLLEAGKKLSMSGKFDDAYDYFMYLHEQYPDLAGLSSAMDEFLYRLQHFSPCFHEVFVLHPLP